MSVLTDRGLRRCTLVGKSQITHNSIRPNHFIELAKVLGNSSVHSLYIQNYPVHCFSISNSAGLDIHHITLNNSAGYAPNSRSNGLPAAHNSDGFDLATTNNTVLRDSTVINQDDCVAVTSGNNILVTNMFCNGSHGLSIGSVGGKSSTPSLPPHPPPFLSLPSLLISYLSSLHLSLYLLIALNLAANNHQDNNVTNISFTSSRILNSENGIRIKSNSNTTGYISNILYANITLTNISTYGIDIQQDYLNGGPTGSPTNGVLIQDIVVRNVSGTALKSARDYYILCGEGSCKNITIEDVDVHGGGVASLCNFKTGGDFDCGGGFVKE